MMGDRVDIFVSHAGADRAWAEWVAWQLTEARYSVELDVWDWAAGQNFMTAMSGALDRCERVVALFSAAYFERERYTTEEWTAAALHAPDTGEGRLIPVRVEDVPASQTPGVLRPLVFRDLFGIDEGQARQVLLDAVAGPRRPAHKPVFPGQGASSSISGMKTVGPRLPGRVPRVWNIPARNPGFTGRDGLLVAVRERLLAGDKAVVQALHGMGGVGKTQLAAEYAHQFAGAYGLAWWVNSERAGLIGDQFAALGAALGCVQPGAGIEAVRAAVLGSCGCGVHGCWYSITPSTRRCDRVAARRWRTCADHLPGAGLGRHRRTGRGRCAGPAGVGRDLAGPSDRAQSSRCGPYSQRGWGSAAGGRAGSRVHGRDRHAGGPIPGTAAVTGRPAAGPGHSGRLPPIAGRCGPS